MSYIAKPRVHHPGLKKNRLGLTRRDYEGGMSTLCAGCGHDSVTAAFIEAFWELGIAPERVGKMSGIGCSGKTPAYFMNDAHGLNALHGRMPAITTGAHAANRDLALVGVSGDGDSLSIGLGQFVHAARRNIRMLYVLENNGVYGLTKGQFSASADIGTKTKRGQLNRERPIDPVILALTMGAGFVARAFSGDKEQLVPILKAGLSYPGFAFVDVISPCVTFNDHQGSTKSYQYTRSHLSRLVLADYVAPAREIKASYEEGANRVVRMHNGEEIRFLKVPPDFDTSDRDSVYGFLRKRAKSGEVVTGLLFVEEIEDEDGARDFHGIQETVKQPLFELDFEALCPGADALQEFQRRFQ